MHQNLLWHKLKDVKMFLQNFRAVACLQLELHPFKVEKLDASIRPLFANPVTNLIYSYNTDKQNSTQSMYREL